MARDPEKLRAYQRKWRQENPEKTREYRRRYRDKDPEGFLLRHREGTRRHRARHLEKCLARHREYERARRKNNADALARKDAARRVGISVEAYDAIVAESQSLCAICGNPETRKFRGKTKRLAIDHNHATGAVRGMLCHSCNTMIALSNESPGVLLRAAEYLMSGGAHYAPGANESSRAVSVLDIIRPEALDRPGERGLVI